MRIWHVLPLVVVVVTGCVYPRRGTSLTSVHPDRVDSGSMSAPPDVWQMTVVEAHVRPRNRGDLDWDDNGGLPDVFVRIYRDEEMVWESETIDDTLEPVWNVTLPRNIEVPHHAAMRFEVWVPKGREEAVLANAANTAETLGLRFASSVATRD